MRTPIANAGRLILVSSGLLLLSRGAVACDSITLPPSAVGPGTVAFLGVVIGKATATELLGQAGVPGLRVRVDEVVASANPGTEVQVYLFGKAPDCGDVALERQELEEQYPRGARVSVIGRRGSRSGSDERILSFNGWGGVAVVPASIARTPEGWLDFHAFASIYEQQSSTGFSRPLAFRNAHRSWFEDFEYFRSLLALRTEPVERRVALLENLVYYSKWHEIGHDMAEGVYSAVVRTARLPRATQEKLSARARQLLGQRPPAVRLPWR